MKKIFQITANKLPLIIFFKSNSRAHNKLKVIFIQLEKVDKLNWGPVVFICYNINAIETCYLSWINLIYTKHTFRISRVQCHLYHSQHWIFVMTILTGSSKDQGNAEFEFGASPAGSGEKDPGDYQQSTSLPPLLCLWSIPHLFQS